MTLRHPVSDVSISALGSRANSVTCCNGYTVREKTCMIIHMGWLRLVGSLKLQDSFAKEPYKRDDNL